MHLSKNSSREAIQAAHRAKMEMKRQRREQWWQSRQSQPAPAPRANLSRKHPDNRMTPLEHARRKAERSA